MKSKNKYLPIVGCLWILVFPAVITAQEAFSRSITASAATVSPKIDGFIDDLAWRNAEWFEDFVQKFPRNGSKPSRKTAFAVVYDEAAIYVAVRCGISAPDEIVTRLVRRDRSGEFDTVEITFSPRGDNRTGYGFVVNPSGVKQDKYYSDDNTSDTGWDGIWTAATRLEKTEWTVEIAIPLDQLRFADGTPRFGLQVSRWISALREKNVFNPIPDNRNGVISTAGNLLGTAAIRARKPLILTPESYISYGIATHGFSTRQEDGVNFGGGGYGKIGLLPDVVLDVAMLPDFGQVEVDDVVVNLSAYETVFPEKRPFFLEGAGLFDTPIQLFYSRRLGAPPPSPSLFANESVVHGGAVTPILGATKLTGRTENGVSFGLIEAMLLPTEFLVQNDNTGDRTLRTSTPWTNAVALRSIAEMGKNSTFGVTGTALNPNQSDGAYSGGLDWNALSDNRLYAFRGQVAGSVRFDDVNGKDPSSGAGVWTRIGREGGEPIRYRAEYAMYTDGFDPNDLGYLKRDDLHYYTASIDYSFLERKKLFKQNYIGGGFDGNWTLDGLRLVQSGWVWWSGNWKNDWTSQATAYCGIPHYDDRETRGGPPLKRPGFGGFDASVQSPNEKPLGFSFAGGLGSKPYGIAFYIQASLFLRLGRFELELTPKFRKSTGETAYVDTRYDDTPDEITVAAQQNLTELQLLLKGTVVFTRELTLQLHTQLLSVSADYHHYGEVLPDGTLNPIEYRDEEGNLAEGDFAGTDLVVQALLRWEYRPGSTLFLIYTHLGFVDQPESRVGITESIGAISNEERRQVFMIKLSRRFG